MKYSLFSIALLFQPFTLVLGQATSDIRAIYLTKDVLESNTTAIKNSGFNTAVIVGFGLTADGDITYQPEGNSSIVVATNGGYVGSDALAFKIHSFKSLSVPTDITRLEISMNATNVQALMANPGSGDTTPLFRNLAAIKDAWGLDAVNNFDEPVYDLDSTVQFAKMLGVLGYKYSATPYTNENFWASLVSQAGAVLDRVYLQYFDLGASNDPTSWAATLGLDVVPLLSVDDSTPAQAQTQFTTWKASGGVAGGGFWNDNDIEANGLSYAAYGGVLTSVFP